jgi:hypothetical protein
VDRFVVISGCSSGRKSTLIGELHYVRGPVGSRLLPLNPRLLGGRTRMCGLMSAPLAKHMALKPRVAASRVASGGQEQAENRNHGMPAGPHRGLEIPMQCDRHCRRDLAVAYQARPAQSLGPPNPRSLIHLDESYEGLERQLGNSCGRTGYSAAVGIA